MSSYFTSIILLLLPYKTYCLFEDTKSILPKRVLARLDAKAKSAGESRSGYIAHLAISD
jgi:hypothetical protein